MNEEDVGEEDKEMVIVNNPRISMTMEILSKINNKENKDLLLNDYEHETQNFKSFIANKYEIKNKINKLADIRINENEEETDDMLNRREEEKIENHIKQFKVKTGQQYSLMRHYFKNWFIKVQEIKEEEKKLNQKYPDDEINLVFLEKLENYKLMKEDENINLKMKEVLVSPTKKENRIEQSKLEKKFANKNEKSKNNSVVRKENDLIHKIPKEDILRFIPLCNDIVIPKKK